MKSYVNYDGNYISFSFSLQFFHSDFEQQKYIKLLDIIEICKID